MVIIEYGPGPYEACQMNNESLYEPLHDKTNIMGLRPAWIQTSLRIRAI
jgi:hypothetical protein